MKQVPSCIYSCTEMHLKSGPFRIFSHRSRVEVFFLLPFLLWIYHLKKKRSFLVMSTSIQSFIYSSFEFRNVTTQIILKQDKSCFSGHLWQDTENTKYSVTFLVNMKNFLANKLPLQQQNAS